MKFEPVDGDTNVIGNVDFITRNALGSVGVFDANVTANSYDSVAQNIYDAHLRFQCDSIPDGIENGDTVTVDIVDSNGVLIATNVQAL